MRFLTPILMIAVISLLGLQNVKAQADLSGFDELFTSAANAAIGTSVGGGGTGTTDQSQSEDRDGGGSIDMINANWPVVGKMIIRSTKLTWDEGVAPTKITLKQGANLVFTSPVRGNSITLDFALLDLDTSKTYNLQLTDGEKSSRRTAIQFVPASELDKVLESLEADISYKKADGTKKKLMKAFFLEKNMLNYEAFEAYHIPTSDPADMKIILRFFNDFKSRT